MLYDIVIIGSGVAGLSAGIYAGRANKSVLIIEDNNIGGTTVTLPNINNYPGFTNISGVELVSNMYQQCLNFDVKFDFLHIDSIDFDRNIIRTDNNIIEYKTLIIASGSTYKRLNIDTEEKFKLHGLSYCAVCDGNLYKQKNVCVVGGGNNALESALYLSNICKHVYLLVRKDVLRGDKKLSDDILKSSNIEIKYNTEIKDLKIVDDKISGVITNNEELNVSGIFVNIGYEPSINILKSLDVNMEKNYILVDKNMETNIKGIYACGDIIKKDLYQLVTAVSEGAIAANYISKSIKK